MAEAVGLADFNSYDLDMVIADVAKAATLFPLSPATGVLRSACVRNLRWDNYCNGPWDDPTFGPRFLFLRGFVVDPLGASLPASAALAPLRAILELLEAQED